MENSSFGIVVLSHHFFQKNWPVLELNALVSLEVNGQSAVLPVWKDISHATVAQYSPLLADKYAVKSYEGYEKVCSQLVKRIDPSNSYPDRLLEKEIQKPDDPSHGGLNVTVGVQLNMRPIGSGQYQEEKDYVCISVNNLGPRQVIIEKAGLHQKTPEKPFMIASDSFYYGPRRLRDGERADYMIEQDLVKLELVDYAWAIDQVGRTWKCDFPPVKK